MIVDWLLNWLSTFNKKFRNKIKLWSVITLSALRKKNTGSAVPMDFSSSVQLELLFSRTILTHQKTSNIIKCCLVQYLIFLLGTLDTLPTAAHAGLSGEKWEVRTDTPCLHALVRLNKHDELRLNLTFCSSAYTAKISNSHWWYL